MDTQTRRRSGPKPRRLAEPDYEMLPLRATIPTVIDGATLAVGCWCERRILLIPLPLVLEGRTGSCGRTDCRAA